MQSKIQDAFEEGYCDGLQHEGMADAWLKSAARARELEDSIPEAPADSDIGRAMTRLDTITVWADPEALVPPGLAPACRKKVIAAMEDIKGMPTFDTRGDERDEETRVDDSRMDRRAPIGHYICPTCGRKYFEYDDLPTMAELVTWLQTGSCDDCREEAASETEWQVEWWINVTAATPREAARKAQAMQRDPQSIATGFTVRPWRDGEVQQEEDYYVDLASDVPPTLPDDADWVPGQ